jgi:hypothetical protein
METCQDEDECLTPMWCRGKDKCQKQVESDTAKGPLDAAACSRFRALVDGDTIQVGDQWTPDDGATWETYQPKDNSIGENWQTGFPYNPVLFYPFRRSLTDSAND